MSNPNPLPPPEEYRFKPGQSGNPKGKPKGVRHLKTIIQEIGHNIDWAKTTLKDKENMKRMYGNSAWDALAYVAFTKAMAGDTKAMDWLAKNGYGQSLDITSDGNELSAPIVRIIDERQDQS